MANYPTASLTADLVILRMKKAPKGPYDSSAELQVLLIERGGEPFKGQFALPGGFVNAGNGEPRHGAFCDVALMESDVCNCASRLQPAGETFREAAVRELREETGLELSEDDLSLVGTYDTPGRDPRGRVVTQAFYAFISEEDGDRAMAGDDAAGLVWYPIRLLSNPTQMRLAFDHDQIVRDALSILED